MKNGEVYAKLRKSDMREIADVYNNFSLAPIKAWRGFNWKSVFVDSFKRKRNLFVQQMAAKLRRKCWEKFHWQVYLINESRKTW